MLYYILSFFQQVKKQFLLIFCLYFGLYVILVFMSLGLDLDLSLFNMLLGCPQYDDMIKILWVLFQTACHIYIVFSFFSYEQDSSFEFLLLRISYQKNFLRKMFFMLGVTVVIRFFLFFGTYLFFYHTISFPWTSFVYNFVFYLMITILTSLAFIFAKQE